MKLLVINGPNINLLGVREPEIYGKKTYKDLCRTVKQHCKKKNIKVRIIQSNYEGKIITEIQKAGKKFDGIVINPAGYTHTSVAIADAIKAVNLPCAEVHISDTSSREDFRKHSFISPVSVKTVSGKGISGYIEAIDFLENSVLK